MIETSWRKNNVLKESFDSPELDQEREGGYYDHNPNYDTEEYRNIK